MNDSTMRIGQGSWLCVERRVCASMWMTVRRPWPKNTIKNKISTHQKRNFNPHQVHRVLRAPLAFFHTNPSGRVLNRFSKDQSMTDEVLPQVSFDALQSGFMVIGAFVLVSWVRLCMPLADVFVGLL